MMNDFTKEELKELRASISATEINNSGAYGDKNTYESAKKLYNKIQSMIDNYCEHDPERDFHVCVDKCKKCGAIVVYD